MVCHKVSGAKIFIISGAENSGKDEILQGVEALARNKASVIAKHSSRNQKLDDGNELICKHIIKDINVPEKEIEYISNPDYNLDKCDIVYRRKGNSYGLITQEIWDGLQQGFFQIIALSDSEAINRLVQIFGDLVVLIYAYSNRNAADKEMAFDTYLNNINMYDHVLIYEDKKEDLYDQIFRLMNFYEV